jgi:hypothetical protein
MTWPLSWVRQLWERAPRVPAPAMDGDAIRRLVVQHAVENIGYGEVGGNNQGPLIEALGGRQGMEWCALFAGWCYRRAYKDLGLEPPAWLFRRPGVPEPGAKRPLW